MHEDSPQGVEERRKGPRRDAEPIRWRDIALRIDRESLPFLHYFDELNKKPKSENDSL